MPTAFDNCVKDGGYIKTLQLGSGKYRRTCARKGKTYKGEVKKKKN